MMLEFTVSGMIHQFWGHLLRKHDPAHKEKKNILECMRWVMC